MFCSRQANTEFWTFGPGLLHLRRQRPNAVAHRYLLIRKPAKQTKVCGGRLDVPDPGSSGIYQANSPMYGVNGQRAAESIACALLAAYHMCSAQELTITSLSNKHMFLEKRDDKRSPDDPATPSSRQQPHFPPTQPRNMKLFNAILLLTMALAGSAQGPPKLGDVFQVDMRPWPEHRGSCNRRRYPRDDTSAFLFDANAPFTDRNNILNIVWNDMCRMIMESTQFITADWYNRNYDIRKLMMSFFGKARYSSRENISRTEMFLSRHLGQPGRG